MALAKLLTLKPFSLILHGKSKQPIKRFLVHLLMIFLAFLAIVPLYVLLINATRSTVQINLGLSLIPGSNILSNWNILTSRGSLKIWRGFANSAFISVITTFLSIYFSAMTAYGLHVYRFKGRLILWTLILIVITLPGSLAFIGFYQQMVRWKLINTYIPLIIPGIAAAVTVLFIRQYMSAMLSIDLIDAARIDGAGEYYIFNIIIIPIIIPALAAQSIFTFVGSWNNFLAPFVMISSQEKYTLPMVIYLLRGNIYNTQHGGIYLGLAISLAPIIIFYSFMARFIISGITLGKIKG